VSGDVWPGGARLAWSYRPGVVTLVVRGTPCRVDAAAVCRDLRRALARSAAVVLVCDLRGIETPDLVAVELLTRLRLVAHRSGVVLRLVHPSEELRQLIALTGLAETLLDVGRPPPGP
jgi:anti-anti-sigma regulatory factor